MVKLKPTDILFWILACLTMALLVGFLLVLGGAISVESSSATAEAEKPTQSANVTEESATTTPTTVAPTRAEPTQPSPAKTTEPTATASAPKLTNVLVTASRGDCWVQARLGSQTGAVLDERVLLQGETMRLRGRQVWLAVGASGNVDVTVNGKPRQLPSGTISVVLGPAT